MKTSLSLCCKIRILPQIKDNSKKEGFLKSIKFIDNIKNGKNVFSSKNKLDTFISLQKAAQLRIPGPGTLTGMFHHCPFPVKF